MSEKVKIAILWIVLVIFCFLLGSYAAWDIDPAGWDSSLRVLFDMIVLIFTIAALAASEKDKNI